MRARVATIASMSALLVTGSAAVMVNSVVLQNATPAAQTITTPAFANGASTEPGVTVVPTDAIPDTDAAPNTQVVVSSVPSTDTASADTSVPVVTAAEVVAVPAAAVLKSAADYPVGRAGTVSLRTSNGVLRVVRVQTNRGWLLAQSSGTHAKVSVTFRSGTKYVVFTANLLYGVVSTSIGNWTTPASTTTTAPFGTTVNVTTTTVAYPAPTTTVPRPTTTTTTSTTTTTTTTTVPAPPTTVCRRSCSDN